MKKQNTRNIIVTGGSRGIGFTVAKAFVRNGDKVLVVSRDAKELATAKKLLDIETCIADVSDPRAVQKIETVIKKRFSGVVHVLVNAAGIYGPKGPLEENDLKLWKKTIEVNLLGTVYVCALVIPYMKRAKFGRIINFSGGGEGPFPFFTAYASSKGAVVRFTESLAAEHKASGIRVNAIAPGAVNTALVEEVLKAGPKHVGKEFYERSIEQKKNGGVPPEKAAELVMFLAGNEAGHLTGKMLSAIYDSHDILANRKKEIADSDIYTFRRIKPKDRGYSW